MTPVRHISHARPFETTLAGEALPGRWRYSSRLGLLFRAIFVDALEADAARLERRT